MALSRRERARKQAERDRRLRALGEGREEGPMDWLTLSVVGNVIQAVINVLLFFKPFLNKLAERWWVDRRQEAKHRRDLLKMLSAHLEQLPGAYFNWLVFASLAQYDQTDEGRSQAAEFRDKNSERLGTIRDFISKNRFDFSLTVQEHLEKLERAMTLSAAELNVLDRSVIDQAIERMQRPHLRLRAVVRAEVQK